MYNDNCMSLENPQIDSEVSKQHFVEGIFQTKKTIENSIQAITNGRFADHHFRINGQTITLQALYGNEFRLYLIEPQESILFEPTPYNNKVVEIISTTRSNGQERKGKTQRYMVNKDGLSESIVSNGDLTPTAKPMEVTEFENANKLLGRIQHALDKALAN